MIRKDMIFAILTTFCLCALMFTVIPIRSGQPYDPWADLNDDGTINMKDVATVASQFGTSGDSTKNVTMKDSTFAWDSGVQEITEDNWYSQTFSTVGFRQVTIKMETNATVRFQAFQILEVGSDSTNMEEDYRYVSPSLGRFMDINSLTWTYDVKGTGFRIFVDSYHLAAEVRCWCYMNSIPSPNMNGNYDMQWMEINASQGTGTYAQFSIGGYSRMTLHVIPERAKVGDYDFTLYPYGIWWTQTSTFESLSPNDFNVTFYAHDGHLDVNEHSPLMLETKGDYCGIFWTILNSHNLPSGWWVTFAVEAYLRDE